jgi:hypothetical protein
MRSIVPIIFVTIEILWMPRANAETIIIRCIKASGILDVLDGKPVTSDYFAITKDSGVVVDVKPPFHASLLLKLIGSMLPSSRLPVEVDSGSTTLRSIESMGAIQRKLSGNKEL